MKLTPYLLLATLAELALPTPALAQQPPIPGLPTNGMALPLLYALPIGGLGALAPEIVRLYRLSQNSDSTFPFTPFYIVMSIGMAGLGGFLAWILPSASPFAAFYVGVATPTIIAAIIRQAGGDGGGGGDGDEGGGGSGGGGGGGAIAMAQTRARASNNMVVAYILNYLRAL